MKRFFDKLIGYVRAIEVAGIDVIDTELNNLAQDSDCTVVIRWRPEHMWTSQLHGTVPHGVRIKSSASLNVPPGSVVDVVGLLMVFMSRLSP